MARVPRQRPATPSPPARASAATAHRGDSTDGQPDRRLNRLDSIIAVTLAIAAIALFAPSWGFDFTSWDDGAYITNNPNLADARGLSRIWFSSDNEQYYPLTFTTYWLEYQLWGDRPAGYHVTNTILHGLNVALVFILARWIGLSRLAAAGVAALFAAHPMQAMSVAWVAERKNLLSCLFVLAATLAWIDFRRRGRRTAYLIALGAFALGLLSKSAIAPAPIAWLVLDIVILNRRTRTSLPAHVPMLALSVAAMLVTRHFERGFLDAQSFDMIPTATHRVLLATTAVWWYASRLLLPVELSPIYPRWQIEPSQPIWWLGAAGLLITIAIAVRWRSRLTAETKWGLPWFILLLAPILGLVAYGNLAVSPTSNHYVYIPCIGLFIAIASLIDRWRMRTPARTAAVSIIGVLVLLSAAVSTRSEATAFRNAETLWAAALAHDPACFPARLGLGQEALRAADLPTALNHYTAATRIRPNQFEGHAGLGETLVRLQKWDEARTSLDTALSLRRDCIPAVLARASVADHDGDLPLALELVRRATTQDPRNPRAALQLGILLLRSANQYRAPDGSPPASPPTSPYREIATQARAAFARVIELRPDDASGYRGAVECDRLLQNWSSAMATARAGLAVDPSNVPLTNLLAITLARCPDERLRDGPAAVKLMEDIRAAIRGNYQLMETLASAYGAANRFEDAALVSREAAKLARQAGNEPAAVANERWAADFDQGKPRLD